MRSETKARQWSKTADLGFQVGVAVLVAAGLVLLYGSKYALHHDLAGSVLSGRLATTLGDHFGHYGAYFPPAERVWFSLAAELTDLTGQRLDLTIVLMTGAAALLAASFAYWIRRETVGASPLFFVLSVAILVVLPIVFKNVFGLREHLIALGLWPYLVLRVSDPAGTKISRPIRLLLGLWMGAALLFKYLYCLVVLLVEMADALVQRRPHLLFRIENIAAGAVVALYLFFWLGVDPGQRAVIGAMLSSIDANLADPVKNSVNVVQNLSFAIFFLFAFRMFNLPKRVMALGLALVIGAVVVALAQQRWYSHHLFPITLAYVAWWWMAAPRFKWWGHLVLAVFLLFPIGSQYHNTASRQQAVDELDAALREGRQSVAGKRVGILTMHPSPYNQYLAAHRALRWNAMPNNAYVAAELKPFDTKEHAGMLPPPIRLEDPGRRMLHEEMLRLWEDMPPDVLILDHSYRWPLRHIDVQWTHVFSKDARFNAILAHYRPVLAHQGAQLEFTYYVRAD
jgi:hypothetical protein